MEKVERFILKPRLQLFFGRTITKDLEFDEYTDNKEIHQILNNCVLTTIINKEYKNDILETKEETKLEQKLQEGQVLIWTEEMGYVLPEYSMTTIEEAIDDLKPLIEFSNKGDGVNDAKGNEGESL